MKCMRRRIDKKECKLYHGIDGKEYYVIAGKVSLLG